MERSASAKYVVPPGSLVISGPQGCGKSRHAKALARYYGKTRVIDDWIPGTPIPGNALALTHETRLINAIPFKNAMRAAGLANKVPA